MFALTFYIVVLTGKKELEELEAFCMRRYLYAYLNPWHLCTDGCACAI